MSADNWAICPRCLPPENPAMTQAEAQYGKVTASQYAALIAYAKAHEPATLGSVITFREDYQIGVDAKGDFSVQYRGLCTVCGFKHTFDSASVSLKNKT